MKSFDDALRERFLIQKNKGGVNSPFNDAVARVKETITDMNWSFGRWCGYLKNIPPCEIHSMLSSALQTKNTGKHFLWLVKEYKKFSTEKK